MWKVIANRTDEFVKGAEDKLASCFEDSGPKPATNIEKSSRIVLLCLLKRCLDSVSSAQTVELQEA